MNVILDEAGEDASKYYKLEIYSSHEKNIINLTIYYDNDDNSVTIHVDKQELEKCLKVFCESV